MALATLRERQFATQWLISQLTQLNKQSPGGLSNAVIGALASPGTVNGTGVPGSASGLIFAILALNPRQPAKFYRDNIRHNIRRCYNLGTLTDAMVETARAAGLFSSLITAIVSGNASLTLDTTSQPYQLWASGGTTI